MAVRNSLLEKFPANFDAAGKSVTLLENSLLMFRQHEMLSLPRFGKFPARKMAAGKSALSSGALLDFLL